MPISKKYFLFLHVFVFWCKLENRDFDLKETRFSESESEPNQIAILSNPETISETNERQGTANSHIELGYSIGKYRNMPLHELGRTV